MGERKPKQKYFFSVEGETEQWYLEWLKAEINKNDAAAYEVLFDIKIEKNPVKRVRGMTIINKTEIWHLSDYESDEDVHTEQFIETMDKMKEAQRSKQVKYFFGYSNLAFDLWIVLHKRKCNGPKSHRRQYLSDINRAYDEHFENMHQYKHEDNFKRCLSKLTLGDVKIAVQRAKDIMKTLKDNQAHPQQYKGFEYYTENPSLEIWRIVEKILIACKL